MEYKVSAFASQTIGGQVEVEVIIVEVIIVEVVGCIVVSVSQMHSGYTNVTFVFRFSSQYNSNWIAEI